MPAALAGAFAGGGILANLLIGLLLGKLFGPDEPETPKDQGVQVRLQADPANKLPVVYGERRVGGMLTMADISSNNQKMAFIITLSEGPVEAINEVYWQDKKLSFANPLSSTLQKVTNAVDGENESHDFLNDGRFKVAVFLGGSNNNCPPMEAFSSKWATDKSERLMPGIAYAYVELTYDRDKRVTGLPSALHFNVKGRKVKTISSGGVLSSSEAYSVNPAECLVDYLSNTAYGCSIPVGSIDLVSAYNHKVFCDEIKTYTDADGSSASAKRYTTNGVLNTNVEADRLISQLTISNSVDFNWNLGKFALVTGKVKSSTHSFSEDNIYGGVSVSVGGFNRKLNRLTSKYSEKQDEEAESQVIINVPESNKNANEPLLEQTWDFPFTNNNIEAERAGAIILNQSRQDIVAVFVSDLSAYSVQSGDVVSLTHAPSGFSSKKFRVLSIEEIIRRSGEIGLKFTVQEYADEVYTDRSINEYDVAPNTNFPNVYAAPVVTSLIALEDASINEANLTIAYLDGNPVYADKYEIGYRINANTSDPLNIRTTDGTQYLLTGLKASETYFVSVTPISTLGNRGTAITTTGTTATARVRSLTQRGAWPSTGIVTVEPNDVFEDNGSLWFYTGTTEITLDAATTDPESDNNSNFRWYEVASGTAGATWHSGAGAPGGTLGSIGDFYLRTSNNNVYEKTGTTSWALRTSIQGDAGKFTIHAQIRSATAPSLVAVTGGSFTEATNVVVAPTGYTLNAVTTTTGDPVWDILVEIDPASGDQSSLTWSVPQRVYGQDGTNADGQNFIYLDAEVKPPVPADSAGVPSGWLDLSPATVVNTLYFSLGIQTDGVGDYVWGNIQQFGGVGTTGAPGARGAATYYSTITGRASAPVATDAQFTTDALAAIVNILGAGSTPVEGDRASIQYDLTGGTTKIVDSIYDSSAWIAFDQKIDGNLLVTGTVAADSIRGNTLTGAKIQTAATGKRMVIQAGDQEAEYYGSSGNKLITWGHTYNEENDSSVTSNLISVHPEAVNTQPGVGMFVGMNEGGYIATSANTSSPVAGLVYASGGDKFGGYSPFYVGSNTQGPGGVLYKFLGNYTTTLSATPVPDTLVTSTSNNSVNITSCWNSIGIKYADISNFPTTGGTIRIGGVGGEVLEYQSISGSLLEFSPCHFFTTALPSGFLVELLGSGNYTEIAVTDLPEGVEPLSYVTLGAETFSYDSVATESGVHYLRSSSPQTLTGLSLGDPVIFKRWLHVGWQDTQAGDRTVDSVGVSITSSETATTGIDVQGVTTGAHFKATKQGILIEQDDETTGLDIQLQGTSSAGQGIKITRGSGTHSTAIYVENGGYGNTTGIFVDNREVAHSNSQQAVYTGSAIQTATSRNAYGFKSTTGDLAGSGTTRPTILGQSFVSVSPCVQGRNTDGGYAFYAQTGGYGPFTGSHDALINEAAETKLETGDIVVDTSEIYSSDNISDIITKVEPSDASKDKKVLGIFTGTVMDTIPTDGLGALSEEELTDLIEQGYKYCIINAVGEGKVNVCKDGGDIEIGDLIVTSSRIGKGMKQDDDIVRSYTVAKARQSVAWLSDDDEIKQIGCTYMCG